MRYRSPSLVSLLTLLVFLTSACAEDSLTGVVEVCQLDLDCDDSDPMHRRSL